MKLKTNIKISAISRAVYALFFLSIPIWNKVDDIRLLFSVVAVGLIIAFLSYTDFKEMKNMKEEEGFGFPSDASSEQKVKYYKRLLYISLVVFPVGSIKVALDLKELESGSVPYVTLWSPVSFIYEQFGYWASITIFPVIGLFLIYGLVRRIRLTKLDNKT